MFYNESKKLLVLTNCCGMGGIKLFTLAASHHPVTDYFPTTVWPVLFYSLLISHSEMSLGSTFTHRSSLLCKVIKEGLCLSCNVPPPHTPTLHSCCVTETKAVWTDVKNTQKTHWSTEKSSPVCSVYHSGILLKITQPFPFQTETFQGKVWGLQTAKAQKRKEKYRNPFICLLVWSFIKSICYSCFHSLCSLTMTVTLLIMRSLSL